jgi:hypothetical protein
MREDNVCKGVLVPGMPHPLLCPEKNEGWGIPGTRTPLQTLSSLIL